MINITDKHDCCGCESCVQACPKQCISFDEDTEGFRYPKVDALVCVECGACEKACPIQSPYESHKPLRVCGAINPDDVIRMQSSSGGIFSMLAESVIREGGVVYGVRFDVHWQAVFDYTETIEGLAAFRSSKYVQARVSNAFKETRDFLKQGRKVLFSGTPCQVAALRHFLRKEYENLLCVDFICHGVPSPKVWGRYLEEVTWNAVRAISDVQFRNNKHEWKQFKFDLTYDSNCYYISSCHQGNHFMRLFLQDIILRPSCYECKAKSGRSRSDLTIADFWGIEYQNPRMNDDKGSNLVFINTEKGNKLMKSLSLIPWETQYNVTKLNPCYEQSRPENPRRQHFFAGLNNCSSIIALTEETLRVPLYLHLYRISKKVIRKIVHTFDISSLEHKLGKDSSDTSATELFPTSIPNKPDISSITFRSKKQGWKQYRMEIVLKEIN